MPSPFPDLSQDERLNFLKMDTQKKKIQSGLSAIVAARENKAKAIKLGVRVSLRATDFIFFGFCGVDIPEGSWDNCGVKRSISRRATNDFILFGLTLAFFRPIQKRAGGVWCMEVTLTPVLIGWGKSDIANLENRWIK